jgi:hypothetical protein
VLGSGCCGFSKRGRLRDLREAREFQMGVSAQQLSAPSGGSLMPSFGGEVIKQRVARPGGGRSGGYRVLIAYRHAHRAVFLYGFAKRERDNIDPDELVTLKEIAGKWLAADTKHIVRALNEGVLQEVTYDEKKEN